MRENFTYCDSATIVEEQLPSSLNRLTSWDVEIRCVENAWIVPFSEENMNIQGEVITCSGTIIPDVCSGNMYQKERYVDIPTMYENQDEVIYFGAVNPCWGHYITDGISKLWCLRDPMFRALLERGVPVVFVSEWIQVDNISRAWKHLVDLLEGENIKIIPLKEVTKFKKIYIPSNTIQNSVNGRFFTKKFSFLIESLREAALCGKHSLKHYDKIYLSRTKLISSGHTEFGERQLENAFQKAGYNVIYPEQLSFEDQVYMLHNAKSVAGTMGSISHNFMFCQPGTDVVILRKAWYTNDFQYVINQSSDLNVTYIDCNLSVFIDANTNGGPFYLYINENVQRFFMERYNLKLQNGFNRRKFQEYAMLCMQRGNFKERNVAPTYYFDKMVDELKNHPGGLKQVYRWVLALFGSKLKHTIQVIISRITR